MFLGFFIPKEYNIKQALSNFALLWDKVLNAVEKLQFVWLEYSVTCNHISLTQLCSRWQAEYSVIKHSMPCSTHLLSLENPMVSSPHRRNLYNPNTKASITTRTKHHQEQTSCLFSSSPTIMKASGQLSDAAVSIVASQQQGPGSKSRLGFVCLGGISIFLHRYKEEEKGKMLVWL